MNEKAKKRLKTIGIITGGVIAGTGLMYIGYLAGTGFIRVPGIHTYWSIDVSEKAGKAIDLCCRKTLSPGTLGYAFSKDEASTAVKLINGFLQEAI